MPSIEASLFTRLSTHAGLSALVSTRVYPFHLPQNPTYPAVSFTKVSSERISAMGSDTGVVRKRFQVSAWGQKNGAKSGVENVYDVAVQIRAALQRWSGTVGGVVIQDTFIVNELDLFEPGPSAEHHVYHVPVDVEIIHEE